MSERFERRLAQYLKEFLKSRPPKPGQILLAKFDSKAVTDRFAEALVSEIGVEGPPVEVAGNSISLPAYIPEDGVPTYIIRVKPEVTTQNPGDHVVVQGFATKMRNLISESANSAEPRAMLMVMDTDSSLDTLEASEDLFAEDGPINLDTFQNSILDPSNIESTQGKALLKGLKSVIDQNSIQAESTEVLDTLCEIRDAIEDEEYNRLPSLIGELPQFLHDDMLTEQFLTDKENEKDLAEAVEETLKSNLNHAKNLQRAHRAGVDTESRLKANYEESFINEVLELGDWSWAKHSKARKHKEEGKIRRFQDIEIDADDKRIYNSQDDGSKIRQALLLVAKDGDISVTAQFNADLENTPFECISPSGDDIGRVSKRKERVTASIEDLDPEIPHYATFQFYVGKKTTRGKSTHQFDIAIVPEWFFRATSGTTFDIDVEEEILLLPGDTELHLEQLERLDFDFESCEVDITESGETVSYDSETIIRPKPTEVTERLTFQIAPPEGVPVEVAFLTETTSIETEEVILPLMLSAIVEPNHWGQDSFLLPDQLSINTERGEIYRTSGKSIGLEDPALELLQIEERIINDGTPLGREVESDSINFGSVVGDVNGVPESLLKAYEELFDHFKSRERTPTSDQWDQQTQELVQSVLESYVNAAAEVGTSKSFAPSAPLRSLGTIQSTTSDKVWLTPFHPVLLAYGLRIAEWRDEDLIGTADAGFRREEFIDKFSPSGIFPYRTSDSSDQLLRGLRYRENPLWQIYSPVESPGAVTPSYMERVIRDKLYTFVQAFPTLFSLHPERHLVINLVNMGDLESAVKGLFQFYRKINSSEFESPTILLRIYGDKSEGESLDQFFNEASESRLRSTLEGKDDELVDTLRRKVHYIHEDEYVEEDQKPAHITFFRGLLEEQSGIMTDVSDLPSGTLKEGLFSREAIDVEGSPDGVVYTVGFSCDEDADDLIHNVARVANALEAGAKQDSYKLGQAPKKRIASSQDTDLAKLWDNSLWVGHVQPNVGIEFYLRSDADMQRQTGKLMIHYSDQYDSSSPNYDVITSTNKRNPYILSLKRALAESELSGQLNTENILSTLVGVDGDLALKLQRANDTEVVEFIGFVGGLALSRIILEESLPDHVWIPISMNELVQHDRAYRRGTTGLFQTDVDGKSSDDLCFIGVPTEPSDSTLKLWLVETKGGSSKIDTGRQQIEMALENLQGWLQPDGSPADEQLLYSDFGKIIVDAARRLSNYQIISEDQWTQIENRERELLEGQFNTSFLKDSEGHIGEVIRIRQNTFQSKIDSDGRVRSIEAPINALEILSGKQVKEILPDLNIEHLQFEKPPTEIQSETGTEEELVISEGDSIESDSGTTYSYDQEEQLTSSKSDLADESDGSTSESTPSNTLMNEESEEIHSQGNTTETSISENGTDDTSTDKGQKPNEKLQQDKPDKEGEKISSDLINQLSESPAPNTNVDPSELVGDLKQAFESLKIDVHPPNPNSISIGPRKVGVDVIPKEGQKIGGILGNLDTLSVQIKAHGDIVGTRVPEKGAVHLEIPHGDPRDIYLREGLDALEERTTERLDLPIGVDTENEHHILSLVDERHALIGGATGSGKSNFLTTVVSALAITHDPEEVKISLIDPKGVDFGAFASLPHVKAGGYFDNPDAGTNHLFNIVQEEVKKRREYLANTGVSSLTELYEHQEALDVEPLPFHVIVIDEYADLIMSTEDEESLEESVTRLAQIGRALGIVILLATQRPSADIVSGKIKANFPCRISFRLPSNTDSRVILDEPGAEDLQGSGDMIVHSQSGSRLNLQGYYLTPVDKMKIIDSLSE
jgi:DNA phosphorothioation-dependent restriction protein DptH